MRGKSLLLAIVVLVLCIGSGWWFVTHRKSSPATVVTPPVMQRGTFSSDDIVVYLVAMNSSDAWNNAKNNPEAVAAGCGDYLVPVSLGKEPDAKLRAQKALQGLFTMSTDDATKKNLENALSDTAKLSVAGIATDAQLLADVTGTLQFAGVCDVPRVKGQIEKTAAWHGLNGIRFNGATSTWKCVGDESGSCQ